MQFSLRSTSAVWWLCAGLMLVVQNGSKSLVCWLVCGRIFNGYLYYPGPWYSPGIKQSRAKRTQSISSVFYSLGAGGESPQITKKLQLWAEEMAQQIMVLAAKADNPSFIPGMNTVGENQFPQVVFCSPHVCPGI